MKKLIFLKLGGSLITDKEKPYTAKLDTIKDLACQIKEALSEDSDIQLLLGNGSGSFAHFAAKKNHYPINKRDETFPKAFAEIQDAALKLNRIVVENLLQTGIPAISVHPSSYSVTENGKTKHIFTEQLSGMIGVGMIPVVYGDVLYDTESGAYIYSTEKVFEAIIEDFSKRSIQVHSIIQATVVPGILDENQEVIPEISRGNYPQIREHLSSAKGFDVTGGIIHKIEQSFRMADLGIKNYIVSGLEKDRVKSALLGNRVVGTKIVA